MPNPPRFRPDPRNWTWCWKKVALGNVEVEPAALARHHFPLCFFAMPLICFAIRSISADIFIIGLAIGFMDIFADDDFDPCPRLLAITASLSAETDQPSNTQSPQPASPDVPLAATSVCSR